MKRLDSRLLMASVGLVCHLHNLMTDLLNCVNVQANLAEFQQMVQYAAPEERSRLLDLLDKK